MIYIEEQAAELFQLFFKDTGGQEWSEAGEYSYSRTTWRGLVVFKQPIQGGAFNVGGEGVEQLSEVWGEFIKHLNESEANDE